MGVLDLIPGITWFNPWEYLIESLGLLNLIPGNTWFNPWEFSIQSLRVLGNFYIPWSNSFFVLNPTSKSTQFNPLSTNTAFLLHFYLCFFLIHYFLFYWKALFYRQLIFWNMNPILIQTVSTWIFCGLYLHIFDWFLKYLMVLIKTFDGSFLNVCFAPKVTI